NARKRSARPTAAGVEDAADRMSWMVREATYVMATAVDTSRPCDRWAPATCPHAIAPSASHRSRGTQPRPDRKPDAPTRTNGVHASVAANGRLIARFDAATIIASDRPPTVAAILCNRSLRRNQYNPNPASSG